MKAIFKIFLAILFINCIFLKQANAIYDPLTTPNNRIGIHILFPAELQKASELVNSTGGLWGYVTIPIQSGDKDIKKWQKFMDEARTLKLIPIIRLATEGDYFKKDSWRKPKDEDVIDFANFLDSLNWPVKNRYIIAFNEVNRSDEWEGQANPSEYAQILSFTSDIFKSKNTDYFIISSGMDNASITKDGTYSQYDFYKLMDEAVPGIFNKIDGFSSHSYPNPAFSQPPEIISKMNISSFLFEKDLIDSMSDKDLPVFITETGWDHKSLTEKKSAEYFKTALDTVWNNNKIVAITPFLLNAGPSPFEKFSFLKLDGSKNDIYKTIEAYKKIKGEPVLNNNSSVIASSTSIEMPVKDFTDSTEKKEGQEIKLFVKWLLMPL